MPGNLDDDALELVGRDVAVAVLVKVMERLTKTFALVALDELGKGSNTEKVQTRLKN